MKSTLALLLAAALGAPAVFAAETPASAPAAAEAAHGEKASFKPDVKRGEQISAQVCASCHANDGSRGSPAYPILQGQHPEYIAKQLADFKSGKRKNPIMQGFASALSEDDMKNVAAFYGTKTAKPGFAKSKDTVVRGEKIYRGGVADRNIPACAACHGPAGSGLPAQYPRIAGQHGDYTKAQLLAFRNGQRANNAVMTGVVAKMNDKEIEAVSDYIAGLR